MRQLQTLLWTILAIGFVLPASVAAAELRGGVARGGVKHSVIGGRVDQLHASA